MRKLSKSELKKAKKIYADCEKLITHGAFIDLATNADSEDEKEFYARTADFFSQSRQQKNVLGSDRKESAK